MSEGLLVPIFPLPDVILLPGAVIPFHLFEPRYVQMIEHINEKEEKFLAISRLLPCGDLEYYLNPEFEPWGTLGEVVFHRENEDKTHDILLLGVERVQLIEAESSDRRLYRTVEAFPTPLPELPEYHVEWLKNHRDALVQKIDSTRDGNFTKELFRKWDEGYMTARSMIHVFVHALKEESDLLQKVLMDEGGDIGIEILQKWLNPKT